MGGCVNPLIAFLSARPAIFDSCKTGRGTDMGTGSDTARSSGRCGPRSARRRRRRRSGRSPGRCRAPPVRSRRGPARGAAARARSGGVATPTVGAGGSPPRGRGRPQPRERPAPRGQGVPRPLQGRLHEEARELPAAVPLGARGEGAGRRVGPAAIPDGGRDVPDELEGPVGRAVSVPPGDRSVGSGLTQSRSVNSCCKSRPEFNLGVR